MPPFVCGGLFVGTGGVGSCCNLRDGTTKHSKRSFWSCHNSKFIQWYCETCLAQSLLNISSTNIIQKGHMQGIMDTNFNQAYCSIKQLIEVTCKGWVWLG